MRDETTIQILGGLLCLGLAGCCGYGGPGCSEPSLQGLCGAKLPLGETTTTLVFFDDTGNHPSTFESVSGIPSERVVAEPTGAVGEILLTGLEVGTGAIEVTGAEGFENDQTFHYAIDIIDSGGVELSCEESDSFLQPIEAD